jgi:NADH-quinone oxidoreductase subunit M
VLSVIVFLPLAVALILLALPPKAARWLWIGASVADMALVVVLWVDYTPGAYEVDVRWIPSVSSGYHLGVDGLSLPLVALTAFLFLACAVYSFRDSDRLKSYAALFLFMQTVSLGLFVALDLILFFVFFDLSIVGMYFIIAGWGHQHAAKAALKFFLYTFLGSLALLLGFIGLFLAGNTFDMVELARQNPLAGKGFLSVAILFALGVGFAVKTPLVPFHTWLPPAHTEAPAAGSAILAGVLLKMGTYGFVRIMMPMLPDTWREYAVVLVVIGVVSVLYGALVALAQQDFKRMIAYTSVNHMGYILLALGAFSEIGVTGAVTQMVSHGLITGALFLLSGVLYQRGQTYEMDKYGGLAGVAPRFAGLTALAAFASLGLPGFSGFIAEFQIFTGSLGQAPVATALAFLGILITAALFLRAFQRVFLGPYNSPAGKIGDITVVEGAAIVPLVVATVIIGIFPRFMLDVIEPASRTVVELVSR